MLILTLITYIPVRFCDVLPKIHLVSFPGGPFFPSNPVTPLFPISPCNPFTPSFKKILIDIPTVIIILYSRKVWQEKFGEFTLLSVWCYYFGK